MEKNFFEAFPNLKLTGARKDLFEQVVVERITATRRKDILRIYIRSERLIEKEDVYGVEQEIKKQFFPKDNIIIKIYEKFILSGQYNPEKLMDTYKGIDGTKRYRTYAVYNVSAGRYGIPG